MAGADPLANIGVTSGSDPLAHIGMAPKDDPLASIGSNRPPPKGKTPPMSAVQKFEAVAGAPQRALQALETGGDIGHAFMHPEEESRLSAQVKKNVGVTGFENRYLGGNDPFHNFARGAIDTGLDIVNDPLTFVPVGKLAHLGVKYLPKAAGLAAKGAEAIEGSKLGEWLAPEYKARHMTTEGRSAVSLAEHQAEDAARALRERALVAVREHADEIRQGIMPPELAALFEPKEGTGLAKIVRPGAAGGVGRTPEAAEASQNPFRLEGDINHRPGDLVRSSAPPPEPLRPTIRPGQGQPTDAFRRPTDLVRSSAPPPEALRPTIRPGSPPEAIKAGAKPSGSVGEVGRGRFTDTMSRSGARQEQSTAWQSHFLDEDGNLTFGPNTKPQDVLTALYRQADKTKREVYLAKLKDAGILGETQGFAQAFPESARAKMFKDTAHIPETQEALTAAKPQNMNPILQAARALTHAGNKAFLGIPIPHILNLTALSYLKYGIPTTLKGLVNAIGIATGHVGPQLAKDIEELRSLSGDSKYHAIFDELGLTKLFGSERAAGVFNAAMKPLQRASNALQEHTLNPAETGLRAAALGAEKRAGNLGAKAVRSIHGTFGTDAANKVTGAASDMAQPFSKFHLQTALAGGLGAMAKHPGRIQAMAHEDTDMNAQGGPAAFHLNVPGMSTMRAVTDPIGYGASVLGPIGQAAGPYSPLTLLRASYQGFQSGNQKQGLAKAAAAVSEITGRFVPEDQALLALYRIAARKKGQAGEDPLADLASSIVTGGFFQKQAAR